MGPEDTGRAGTLIVVPCLNEASFVASVAAAALKGAGANGLVVVADGGSTDGTREIVQALATTDPRLRLMDNPSRIQSAGMNRAVAQFGAGKRWLVRMDAHGSYPDDFVPCLIEEAERTGAQSVVVAMDSRGTGCFQRAAALAQSTLLGAGGSAHRMGNREGFVDHGHHALFDMARFCAIGGYDELQSHNEDAEFDARLAAAGGKLWLTRATRFVYFPRSRVDELYAQYRNYGRGRATTILRHRMRPKLRQLLPAGVAPALAMALASPLFPPALLPGALWLGGCLFYGLALGILHRQRCGLAAGFAAIVMHMGWSVGFWQVLLNPQKVPALRLKAQSP